MTAIVNEIPKVEKDLHEICKAINDIDVIHHKEILRILVDSECVISSNRNGSFVNLSSVPDTVLAKIIAYLDYVKSQEVLMNTPDLVQDTEYNYL